MKQKEKVMQQKNLEQIIRQFTSAPFGVCSYSVADGRLIDCRAKARLPQNAASIICFAFPYKVEDDRPENISRYAAVPDYHEVCGRILEKITAALKAAYPENEFSPFIDNSPIPEVAAAAAAGLGVIGKNGLLITERYGSFVFLGEIVTDLPLPTTDKTARCEDCGLCIKACPVGLCKNDCLSALTQQKKLSDPKDEQRIKKHGVVWGCDICQEICPMNEGAEKTDLPEFTAGYRRRYTLGEDISGRAFAWRGEGVIARNAELLENAAKVVTVDKTEEEN